MSTEIEFNVPTAWDDDQVAAWARMGKRARGVVSIFGSRQQQLVGHGRAPGDVPAVEDATIVHHAKFARQNGIQFLYLLNGQCDHLSFNDEDILRKFFSDLEWIVEEVRADCVVVADLRVARLVRKKYKAGTIQIRVSTIAGVMDISDLEAWLPLGIDGVVLHHDAGRDFERLEVLQSFLRKEAPEAEVELLINETCLHGCAHRASHYARLAATGLGYIEGFQQNCNIPKFRDPSLLLAARWIRPEDINFYRDLGIRRFKVAGREMSGDWLDRAVRAYVSGTYDGNLIDLFTITPPGLDVAAADIFFLSNKALDGFLNQLRDWSGTERDFYKKWAGELWQNGALKVSDPGATYDDSRFPIRCTKAGRRLQTLIELKEHRDPVFVQKRANPEFNQG